MCGGVGWGWGWGWGWGGGGPHPIVSGGDHQGVRQQDGGVGLLDVRGGHHRDGDLGRTNLRMSSWPLEGLLLLFVGTETLIAVIDVVTFVYILC